MFFSVTQNTRVTVRKRSCKKVIFSQACFKNSVHGRGVQPLGRHPLADRHPLAGRHPPGRQTHPPGRQTDTPLAGRQTPPWQVDTPLAGRHTPLAGRHTLSRHPLGRHPPGRQIPPGIQTPPSQTPLGIQTPPWHSDTPPPDGYCSGRYASYWNAFLLEFQIGSCLFFQKIIYDDNMSEIVSFQHYVINGK